MSNTKIYIDLETVKQHLNIDCFYTGDDNILITYMQVAHDVVEKNIDCRLSDLEDVNGELPQGLIGAILLYIGLMYENREAVQRGNALELPLGFRYILDCYRNYNPNNIKPNNIKTNCCK